MHKQADQLSAPNTNIKDFTLELFIFQVQRVNIVCTTIVNFVANLKSMYCCQTVLNLYTIGISVLQNPGIN